MLLLGHEQIHDAGSIEAGAIEPMTARVLYGHRLSRRQGNQVTVTSLSESVLLRGVLKPGRVRDYVQVSELPRSV